MGTSPATRRVSRETVGVPCNASFSHGATYDFCRVTLVFNITEGQVEGTDINGLKVAAIAMHPRS